MPLTSSLPLVEAAFQRRRAVLACNVTTLEMAQGVVAAAEAAGRPLILQFNRAGLAHLGGPIMAAAISRALAEASPMPIALHLDHADTLAELEAAARAGFTSLMLDGSSLPLAKHRPLARAARRLANRWGLPLEAELGHVSGTEAGVTLGAPHLTDPDAAAAFVRETAVDILAVSIGNVHGAAPPGLRLDLARLAAIHAVVPRPLVLHGASGVPEAMLGRAVALGVAKINVGTALHGAFQSTLRDALLAGRDARAALAAARDAVRDVTIGLLTAPYAALPVRDPAP